MPTGRQRKSYKISFATGHADADHRDCTMASLTLASRTDLTAHDGRRKLSRASQDNANYILKNRALWIKLLPRSAPIARVPLKRQKSKSGGFVEHRDVRLDPALFDQPRQFLASPNPVSHTRRSGHRPSRSSDQSIMPRWALRSA